MSQEKNKSSHDDAPVVERIYSESTAFEPGYQTDSLPKITVPDLSDEALSLSADALAQVPTLTESVGDAPATASQALIQDMPAQADTQGEELQIRMGKLSGEIHTLNARLDRIERRSKTKV